MKLYNIFIKAVSAQKRISYREAQTWYGAFYKDFKARVEKRYTVKQVERWLSKWDFSEKSGKSQKFILGIVSRLTKKVKAKVKEKKAKEGKAKAARKENKFLKAFLDAQKYLDDALYDYLEQYVFVKEETRNVICSNLSSIMKACIEFIAKRVQNLAIEAESLQYVEVRGLNFLFKTFVGRSDRISFAKDFFHAVESLLTFVAYNPALYIEFVESEEGFEFSYEYGRDDEGFNRPLRDEDYEIFQNAKV